MWNAGSARCEPVLSRLVRRAYSFSKNAENHLDAIHFFIANYNLSIKQSTAV